MTTHNCTLTGQCEPDIYGPYKSLEECQANCQPSPLTVYERETLFITLSYDPEQVFALAPTDISQYIWREYHIRVNPEVASDTLVALLSQDYLWLHKHGFTDYLHSLPELTFIDFMIFDILGPLDKDLPQSHTVLHYQIEGLVNLIVKTLKSNQLVSMLKTVLKLENTDLLHIQMIVSEYMPQILTTYDTGEYYAFTQTRYKCNLLGSCEPMITAYQPLAECQRQCKAVMTPEERDEYLLSLTDREALFLTNSDISTYLQLRYQLTPIDNAEKNPALLATIIDSDYVTMYNHHIFTDYMIQHFDDFDRLLYDLGGRDVNWNRFRLLTHRLFIMGFRRGEDIMTIIIDGLFVLGLHHIRDVWEIKQEQIDYLVERYGHYSLISRD